MHNKYALQYMLSQHFCQLLAAAAFPNCAATLDKMSAASFDRDWGEYETNENSRRVLVCQDMLLPVASPALSCFSS